MEQAPTPRTSQTATKAPARTSPVKALISWLVATDQEYRVAQSMVNDTRNRN